MKCHKPHTDQLACVQVLVNGQTCPEYVLPGPPINPDLDADILECFIPVSDGDRITLKGEFCGTALNGSIDLLVDGSFLGDRRIEPRRPGQIRTHKRKFDFLKVFDTPVPPGSTSQFPPREVVEGDLIARQLVNPPTDSAGDSYGVGTIIVIISVQQQNDDNYEPVPAYGSTICGAWKDKDTDEMYDGGIGPTHEMEVNVTDAAMHINRQSKHRRHAIQTRFGAKPWATFVFYYRTIASIKAAGGAIKVDKSHKLEASKEVDANEASASAQAGKLEAGVVDAQSAPSPSSESGIFVSPAKQIGERKKKRSLFGQRLDLGESSPAVVDDDSPTFSLFNEYATSSDKKYDAGITDHNDEIVPDTQGHTAQHNATTVPAKLAPIRSFPWLETSTTAASDTAPPTSQASQQGRAAPTAAKVSAHPTDQQQSEAGNEHLNDGNPIHNADSTVTAEDNMILHRAFCAMGQSNLTPNKRACDDDNSCQPSSPMRKKARISDHQAALWAQLEERKSRAAEIETTLEEEQRLRIAEERKVQEQEERKLQKQEESENAEIERQIAAQDERIHVLLKAVQMERDARSELMKTRDAEDAE